MSTNKEQFRWTIKRMTQDAAAKAGVTHYTPDARQISDAKDAYRTMDMNERINWRAGIE